MSLTKARLSYKDVERMMDVRDACYCLVTLLDKLKLIKHGANKKRPIHYWYELYLQRMETRDDRG